MDGVAQQRRDALHLLRVGELRPIQDLLYLGVDRRHLRHRVKQRKRLVVVALAGTTTTGGMVIAVVVVATRNDTVDGKRTKGR